MKEKFKKNRKIHSHIKTILKKFSIIKIEHFTSKFEYANEPLKVAS